MLYNIFKVLISVKAKLFFGFFAMTMIIALLGGYAFISITSAGQVVKGTFDRPLMAINFARSASQVFSTLEIEVLHQINQNGGEVRLDRQEIKPLLDRFKGDLEVAKERSISDRAGSFFVEIDGELTQWEGLIMRADITLTPQDISSARTHADAIADRLDIIVELQTNESFRAREQAIAEMDEIKRFNLWAVSAALALTFLLSAWIAVTIINPLKAAAAAARKIAAGNLEADIPPGGDDETGVLLKTMAAMQRNIRDRMGQEKNLRALAQHRLSDSLANSKDAILLTDSNGLVIVANPQIGQFFPALANLDLIKRPFVSFFEHTGRPRNEQCRYNETQQEISFADGRWARVSASDTQEGGRLYIWSDITEAKQRSQHLREAKNAAEAADEAKTVFLASMSHELRTPLNAVIGFSNLLEAYHKGPQGNADHAEMAELISKSGAHLLNIVQDVLTVAQTNNTEHMPIEMAPVDVIKVADYCLKTIAAEAAKKNITLHWQQPEEPVLVSGDELRLQQLLLNLLSNAITYNEVGGAAQLHVGQLDDGRIRIDVIDNGIGIEERDIERITEPFVQVDAGSTRKYDGVGLGLTIVKKILTAHDGQLHIRSQIGNGTAVTVVLPRLTNSQPGHAKAAV